MWNVPAPAPRSAWNPCCLGEASRTQKDTYAKLTLGEHVSHDFDTPPEDPRAPLRIPSPVPQSRAHQRTHHSNEKPTNTVV